MLEFSIITISSFVTMLDEFVKTFSNLVFKKDISKFIPIFSVVFGVILGIIGYYIPSVEMGNNIVEAVFIGISAGSAATGVNQITKQLNKKEPPSNEDVPSDDDDSLPIDEFADAVYPELEDILDEVPTDDTDIDVP